jgi:hypothetical protein
MNKTLFLTTILFPFAICNVVFAADILPVKKGDILVYRVQSEIYDEKARVKRTLTERKEKVLAQDKGLKYGFALEVGKKWGCDRKEPWQGNDASYCNYAQKIEDVVVPAGVFKNCFKIVYETCPDTSIEWYCPGTGIVKKEYHHHGTITNITEELEKIARK